MNTVISIARL